MSGDEPSAGPNSRSDFFLADGEKIVKRKRSREVIFS
jgi:hypothetical protein